MQQLRREVRALRRPSARPQPTQGDASR
jgi:hypothetical protein